MEAKVNEFWDLVHVKWVNSNEMLQTISALSSTAT